MSEVVSTHVDLSNSTCEIVSAYVSKNHVSQADIPVLIATVRAALSRLSSGSEARPEGDTDKKTPAQIRQSVTPDALISFIDGKSYKTLKRHLSSRGLDPSSYRARYGLPSDYPMVAPSYSERRSSISRASGLGKIKGRGRA